MKSIVQSVLFIVLAQFILAGSMHVNGQSNKKDKTDTVKYWVSMSCENCKAKVEKNIPFEKGVKGLEADLKTKTVTITYRTDKTNPAKLEKAIQELGFKTELVKEEKKQ